MTILILKNKGTNKNNQRKKQTHRQQTHTHTNTGSRGKREHSQLAFPTLPEKHDSKKWVTPEESLCSSQNVPNGVPCNQLCAAMTLVT